MTNEHLYVIVSLLLVFLEYIADGILQRTFMNDVTIMATQLRKIDKEKDGKVTDKVRKGLLILARECGLTK